LNKSQQRDFRDVLLSFRSMLPDEAGAFPRTTASEPSAWTTGQATLALLGLGVPWKVIKPSVEWLLRTQSANGGWNFRGSRDGHEKLIYTLYPTLVLLRCRQRLGRAANDALSRVVAFLESCEEREKPFWIPLRNHLGNFLASYLKRRRAVDTGLNDYWRLFERGWPPIERVDDDWLPNRFNMALMCGPNYLLLRRQIAANHPLALLHVRYLADERMEDGWNDQHDEHQPKTWATALDALTLFRWARDLTALNTGLKRLPERSELVKKLQLGSTPEGGLSDNGRSLVRRFRELRPGLQDATRYQALIRDVFMFLFGNVLRDPKLESKTVFGTLRRDVTFSNTADTGSWSDWKREHHSLSLLIECKNQERLTYEDLRQTACYLGKIMGYFGILVSRKTTADEMRAILNWFVISDGKYILVVNDQSLIDWIMLKDHGEDPTNAIGDLHRSLRERAQ
jgi:hypothetical protein